MISQNTIQQILSRIDIIDVVGSFVKLKKRGANYMGLCPFHNEKSPSFTVSPTKEIYKCFGCGKSGNSIGFVMEHEKYSYVEALKWLAARYNVDVEETEVSPDVRIKQQQADSLFILNGFARDFFADQLFNTEEGQTVGLAYLKERGFREDIIKKFQIGYNPAAGHIFVDAAIAAQYNKDLLLTSGLASMRQQGLSDNYRERIIFPIHNQSGKVLGFGARLIKNNDKAPKYINTPENDIYVKSKLLYGTYFARQAIDKLNECLLVEGYTDVVSLQQAGIENVVASGGTSLTPDQLRLIKKYTNNLTILYDGDGAGVKAALRGLDLAIEEGLQVKLVLIPDDEDPDSYVYKLGAEGFRNFVRDQKKDFILFQLEHALKDAGDDVQKKQAVVNTVAETISKINKTEDFVKRQDYIKRVSEILRIEETGLNNLVNSILRDKLTQQSFQNKNLQQIALPVEPEANEEANVSLDLFSKDEKNERGFIRCLVEFGLKEWADGQSVAQYIFEEAAENDLEALMENRQLVDIFNLYKQAYFNNEQPTAKTFLYYPDLSIARLVIELMDNSESELSPKWKEIYEGKLSTRDDLYIEDVTSALTYLKIKKVRRMLTENERELEVEKNADEQLIRLQTQVALKEMEINLTRSLGTVIRK